MVLYIRASTPTEYPRLTRSQHAISEAVDTDIHALNRECLVAGPRVEVSPNPPLLLFSVSTNDGINMPAENRKRKMGPPAYT